MLKKLSTFIDFDQKSSSDRAKKEYYSKNFDGFDFLSLIKEWPNIAGQKLAEHTIPLKNQNGTLVILSNHSAFASEMKFMEMPLKKKIFAMFPGLEKQIKTIHFIVDSTHFSQQVEMFSEGSKTAKQKVKLPHPFSPEAKKLQKDAEDFFKDIEDTELKNKFISLYIQNKCQ